MKTVIINKMMMHMMDFEHRKVYFSKDFVELNETNNDYYKKKIEKALTSPKAKEIIVGSMHELYLRSEKMLESDDEFINQSIELTKRLYELGSVIQEMPNSNVLIVDCYKDGEKYIAILKLNYQRVPMSVVEKEIVRITQQQILPGKSATVDEAIIINCEKKKLYLIEKKYMIDDKMDFYLNYQWIKGNEELTDKDKLKHVKKTLSKMEDIYNVNNGLTIPLMKETIKEKIENNQVIKPVELAKEILKNDYQAQEECELILNDLGMNKDSEINIDSFSDSHLFDKIKLDLDDLIEISINTDDWNEEMIHKDKNSDGTFNVSFKNIQSIKFK